MYYALPLCWAFGISKSKMTLAGSRDSTTLTTLPLTGASQHVVFVVTKAVLTRRPRQSTRVGVAGATVISVGSEVVVGASPACEMVSGILVG